MHKPDLQSRSEKMLRRARHHYYYYGRNESPAIVREEQEKDSKDRLCEKDVSFSAYARIVRWLYESVGPDDPRGFEPRPMFSFAVRYNLCNQDPAEIYRHYVAYQCHVYAEAAERLSASRLNNSTFGDIQNWYENVRQQDDLLTGWKKVY